MTRKIFVNLPIHDLKRSVAFFTRLGFSFNTRFTDEHATCMIVGENIFVMLLTKPFFKTFTHKGICDSNKSTEVIICLSADTREAVDEMVNQAIEAGGTAPNKIQAQGWMYERGFQDLDGHL